MADYSVTLDGTNYADSGPDPFGDIRNVSNDGTTTNTITVTEDLAGSGLRYAFVGNSPETYNIVLPEGWTYSVRPLGQATAFVLNDPSTPGPDAAIFVADPSNVSVTNVCFTRGAMVSTPTGDRAIEDLGEGDLVLTRDGGAQPLRWVGRTRLTAETLRVNPHLVPVRIAAGALGDNAETLVSPHHRMLISGWRAEALFDETEVLASAESLINDSTIRRADVGEGEYFHIMFASHELVMVDGAWSESFHPAALELGTAGTAARAEIVELFPELEAGADAFPADLPEALDASEVRLMGL